MDAKELENARAGEAMTKLKYTIEADENGYSILLEANGVKIFEAKHKKTAYGSEMASGDDEDALPDPWYDFISDHPFIGLELHQIARNECED